MLGAIFISPRPCDMKMAPSICFSYHHARVIWKWRQAFASHITTPVWYENGAKHFLVISHAMHATSLSLSFCSLGYCLWNTPTWFCIRRHLCVCFPGLLPKTTALCKTSWRPSPLLSHSLPPPPATYTQYSNVNSCTRVIKIGKLFDSTLYRIVRGHS